ncbi:hypothetical protein [Streptacidiphilus rugosus]|uniref:hypothetical protein n=1 Tax=Streptacidiphilus rugosus TaxID=405783 RepID=UPI00055F4F31|nr:hypothetical protein [Streptacidiphilus rugosus]
MRIKKAGFIGIAAAALVLGFGGITMTQAQHGGTTQVTAGNGIGPNAPAEVEVLANGIGPNAPLVAQPSGNGNGIGPNDGQPGS